MPLVRDLLAVKKPGFISISPDATVFETVEQMSSHKIGAILVMQGKALLGVFTERDLMNRVIVASKDPKTTKVSEVMTTRVAVGKIEMPLKEAAMLMSSNRIRHLPIVENGEVVNMISTGDVMARQLNDEKQTIEHLEHYFFS